MDLNTKLREKLRENAALGARVMGLIAELQDNEDPRHQEILEVYNTSKRLHPSYDPISSDMNWENFYAAHRAVFAYVESNYSDLYKFILTRIQGI